MTRADPHNYDLVLDSHSLGLEIAAEVIFRAVDAGRPASPKSANPASWSLSGTATPSVTPTPPPPPPPANPLRRRSTGDTRPDDARPRRLQTSRVTACSARGSRVHWLAC